MAEHSSSSDTSDRLVECKIHLKELAQRAKEVTIEELRNVYDNVIGIIKDIPYEDHGSIAVKNLTMVSHLLTTAAQFELNKSGDHRDEEMKAESITELENSATLEDKLPKNKDCRERFDDFADARRAAIESTIVQDIEGLPQLSDIAGLTEAKNALNEALVDPIIYPEWFTKTDLKPWKSVLLYGPPGTGKTALCHAAAREIKACLYQISSSDLISSWSGQSEKLIRELFDHAIAQNKVVVIFIDEVDSLCRNRSSNEDDANRRVKTELLVQVQRLQKTTNIMLVSATNCPWDLDPAFLRRFEKKIYVGLPSISARISILRKKLSNTTRSPAVSLEWLAAKTEGFSGDDLRRFASEVAYAQFRLFKEQKRSSKDITTCSPVSIGLVETVLSKFVATVDECQLAKFQQYMCK